MRYRKLDENLDMKACNDGHPFYFGKDAVAAAIRSRLLSFQGEWWEGEADGIPFWALTGRMDTERKQEADMYIRKCILGTEGVRDFAEYKSEIKGKRLNVFASVLTNEGGTATVEVSL